MTLETEYIYIYTQKVVRHILGEPLGRACHQFAAWPFCAQLQPLGGTWLQKVQPRSLHLEDFSDQLVYL